MHNTPNTLTILSFNCNGLGSRINELRDFLEENDIDLVLLQETKTSTKFNYDIPNYYLYRNDRPPVKCRCDGGTAIYAHCFISHAPVNLINVHNLENTTIEIHANNNS